MNWDNYWENSSSEAGKLDALLQKIIKLSKDNTLSIISGNVKIVAGLDDEDYWDLGAGFTEGSKGKNGVFDYFDADEQKLAEKLDEIFDLQDCILLKNGGDDDAWHWLDDAMGDVYYDNGLPLTGKNYPEDNPTEKNNYFDHYDRDQDYSGWFDDQPVLKVMKMKPLPYTGISYKVILNLTPREVKDMAEDLYNGVEYAHDFR